MYMVLDASNCPLHMLGQGHCVLLLLTVVSPLPVDIQKLEDLKVLRLSPDLLNNVKIGQGQLQLIMDKFCFYHIHLVK